jgi:hypothetical protein
MHNFWNTMFWKTAIQNLSSQTYGSLDKNALCRLPTNRSIH